MEGPCSRSEAFGALRALHEARVAQCARSQALALDARALRCRETVVCLGAGLLGAALGARSERRDSIFRCRHRTSINNQKTSIFLKFI
ncbi:unnamed protein product [Arctia plantaginis]|uniref:Uncharacterized protein n=1 Tax=Arctia plantaginis TaxID=874455 RepID=A0A8S1BCD3_ARCPL|nr:unnamed protein product [Arctia plantaginis]